MGACEALRNLCRFRDGVEVFLEHEQQIVEQLVLLLKKHSEREGLNAVLAETMMFITKNSTGAKVAVEHDVVACTLVLLSNFKLHPSDMVIASITISWNIGVHAHGKQNIVEGNVMALLLNILANQARNPKVTTCCIGALLSLSTMDDAKAALATPFAIQHLIKCLYLSHVKQNTISTINNGNNVPGCILAYTKALLSNSDLLIEVYGKHCLPALNQLLLEEESLILALQSIEALLESSAENVKAAKQCLHLKDRLQSISGNGIAVNCLQRLE